MLCPIKPAFSEFVCIDNYDFRGSEYMRKTAFATAQRSRELHFPTGRFSEDLVRVEIAQTHTTTRNADARRTNKRCRLGRVTRPYVMSTATMSRKERILCLKLLYR
jgi:hypothetical protein